MEVNGEVKIVRQNILKKNFMSKLRLSPVLWITHRGDVCRGEDSRQPAT
jgi:hypothetical protein